MNKTKKVHIGPSNRMFLKHHETTQQALRIVSAGISVDSIANHGRNNELERVVPDR